MADASAPAAQLPPSRSHPRPFDDHVYQPVEQQVQDDEEQDGTSTTTAAMSSALQRHLTRVQVLTPLAILLNASSLVVCSVLISPSLGDVNKEHVTQFTPNPRFILLYWAVLFLLQVGFAVLIVAGQKEFTKRTIVNGVGVRLALANILLGVWAITFVVNNDASFKAGFVLIAVNGLILLLSALILAIKYPPSTSRPLDWLFIHVPVKMFLVITLQLDIPQMLFLALNYYDAPDTPPKHQSLQALWPSFGIIAGVGALSAIWIFAACDVTWAASGIYLYFSLLYSKSPTLHNRRPEIVAAIILAMVLQGVALVGSLLYRSLGHLQQHQEHDEEGRVALGRNPQEEAAALRAEAEAEAAAAVARERALATSTADVNGDEHAASTTTGDEDPSALEQGQAGDGIKVSRKLGSSTS